MKNPKSYLFVIVAFFGLFSGVTVSHSFTSSTSSEKHTTPLVEETIMEFVYDFYYGGIRLRSEFFQFFLVKIPVYFSQIGFETIQLSIPTPPPEL